MMFSYYSTKQFSIKSNEQNKASNYWINKIQVIFSVVGLFPAFTYISYHQELIHLILSEDTEINTVGIRSYPKQLAGRKRRYLYTL